MGYLTTITFRNDDFNELEKDPEAALHKIRRAMNGERFDDGTMVSHGSAHSKDIGVFVVTGNTSVDVSAYGSTEMRFRESPTFMREISKILSGYARDFHGRMIRAIGKA